MGSGTLFVQFFHVVRGTTSLFPSLGRPLRLGMRSLLKFSSFSSVVDCSMQKLHGYIDHRHVEKMHA